MRVRRLLLVLLLGLPGAWIQAAHVAAQDDSTLVFIGTQGDEILGARLDGRSGRLTLTGSMAKLERPTWIVTDPTRPLLYSVSEIGNYTDERGSVHSFSIDPATGKLGALSRTDSGGNGPTFLSFDPRAKALFVANFGKGHVAAIPVRDDGSLAPATSVVTDYGTGPSPKQRHPHAHAALLDPSGKFVLTPDMGADRVFVYRYDIQSGALAPADPPFESTGPATGPRHLAFSPDGRFAFVLAELSSELRVFRWDAANGRLAPVQSVPVDLSEPRSAAEILSSRDGRFLYISSRAANSIIVFGVDKQNGTVTRLQEIASGGDTPRSFGIDPSGRWMIVGNQASKTLAVFRIDAATGRLSAVGGPLPVPQKPVAFAFYPP
ncbi:MAG: lactonase family protein [Pseudomonadota bacterium]